MPEEDSGTELELRDYLRVLSRRKMIVIFTVLVVVGASILMSVLQEPVYQGTARLLLQARASESPFDPSTGQRVDPDRALVTEIEVLKSQLVQEEVRRQLGSAPKVTASPLGRTDVVTVSAESTDPKRAAAVANAYATAYINLKRKQSVDGLLTAGKEIQEKITSFQKQIDDLDAQVAAAASPNQAAIRESLSAQRSALVEQQALFRQTLDKLTVDANLATGGAQLVGTALVPTVPIKPTPARSAVLATVVGMLLGVGLAFLVEYLDDSIKTKEELERVAGMVPVLGLIPSVDKWKTGEEAWLVSRDEPRSLPAEAYRTLRTATQFVAIDRPMGTLQITSPSAGDGKTTTLTNLGVALATAGQRVILVDCDLRRPRLHQFFGLSNETGFTSLLVGDMPISAVLQQAPGVRRLRVLPSGPLPPNPSELLSSERTAEVFAALRAEADIVLIDSPPVLPVTDALVLFRQADAAIMVFSARKTTRKQASTALQMAQQVDAPLVGAVLNGVSLKKGYSNYSYAYYYATDEPNGSKAPAPEAKAANGSKSSKAKVQP
ncbi:MAG: tyrosine-protein kinase [Actinomycetota bacterium]|nr:tyrosine-protein kinase [Actinomycetota bacterium]